MYCADHASEDDLRRIEIDNLVLVKPRQPIPQQWTPELVRTYDFTGWRWGALPFGTVKSARGGNVQSDIVTLKHECIECRRTIWACSPLENLCEEDDYYLHERNREMIRSRAKRNAFRPVNPFAGGEF